MTETEAASIIAMIANRYPTPALSDESQELWARVIEDMDFATTTQVVERWMRSEPQRPDPADLRRMVAEAQAPCDSFLEPGEAWARVKRAIVRVGRYRPFPGDGLVAEAVAAIGWEMICDGDNPEADRAHFMQIYRQLLERARRQSAENTGAAPQLGRRRGRLLEITGRRDAIPMTRLRTGD